ncbi:MAG: hypothetical protein QM490_01355 [Candidatus Gracilibacteria bacterium]
MGKIIITLFLGLSVIGGIFAGSYIKENNKDNNKESGTGVIISTNSGEITTIDEKTIIEKDLDKDKENKDRIEALRKKLALRGLILKGDINLEKGEYTSALVKYLQIHKQIPEDKSTIKKLGDVYFNLLKFEQAYGYYSQIKDYNKLNKDRVAKTLLAFTTINNNNIGYLNSELESLGLSEEQLFYYKNSITCKNDFSLCKLNFQEYFTEKIKNAEIIEGTGSIEEIPRFEELYNIEKALINYENFQIDDLLYKGALVSGAFFENGLYPIAIETSKVLLENKSDYKPLLKIVAKSYYELGNYIEAKLYLIKYNKLEENDSDVSYFLGIVYEKLHEYILSNIHLSKALKIGYTKDLDIYKRILFNYYELGEILKMLETMKIIINDFKDELTINDFNIAIYYHIINDETKDAKGISELALEKYPESSILNGYYGWILMEIVNSKAKNNDIYINNDTEDTENLEDTKKDENINSTENEENIYSEAEKYITKGLEIDSNSPMLNLVKGKLEINKGDIRKAFMYFKKTIAVDKNGDFGKIAAQELENIQINK